MRVLSSQEELEEAQQWAEPHLPQSAIIWLWLKVNLDRPGGSGTSGTPRCYVDCWPKPNIVAGVDFVESYHLENLPLLCMFTDLHQEKAEKVETFLLEVSEHSGMKEIGAVQPQAIGAEWVPIFHRVFAQRSGLNASITDWPCKAYYVTEEERKRIRTLVIPAPDGFEFQRVTLSDAEFVDAVWPHRFVGSLKLMQRRIEGFPSVALREIDGQKRVVSFELINDQLGIANHLYTVPEFRRRGLATVVELKMVQVMLEHGYFPIKTVVKGNTSGEKVTDSSPLWTYYADVAWLRYGDDRILPAFEEIDGGSVDH